MTTKDFEIIFDQYECERVASAIWYSAAEDLPDEIGKADAYGYKELERVLRIDIGEQFINLCVLFKVRYNVHEESWVEKHGDWQKRYRHRVEIEMDDTQPVEVLGADVCMEEISQESIAAINHLLALRADRYANNEFLNE